MKPFSIDIPLHNGPLLVEASAGTGKTWSIARLVARLLAEDPPDGGLPLTVDQVLVVTFTNAATAELRERVRSVLADAAQVLDDVNQNPQTMPKDPGFAALAGRAHAGIWQALPSDRLLQRSARLHQAVRDFDQAAISTIHGFCQQVVRQLAFESSAAFDDELSDNTQDLLEEVVDDWLARTLVETSPSLYRWLLTCAGLRRDRLLEVARQRLGAREAQFLPERVPDWQARIAARQQAGLQLYTRCQSQEGAELFTQMLAASADRVLHAAYQGNKTQLAWQNLLNWLEDGALTPPPTKLFFQSEVEKKTYKNKTPPHHLLLVDLEALGQLELDHAPLADFAAYVSDAYAARLLQNHQLTYDDLLVRVRDGLRNPQLVQALRRRFRAALIDEFQDTDALQWQIFRQVYMEDRTARLILIGDPKQAIYAFRGADVNVYAEARALVPEPRRLTMATNFRSDAPLLQTLNTLMGGQPNLFASAAIQFEPVDAWHPVRIVDAANQPVAPVELRWFDGVSVRSEGEKGPSRTDVEAALPALVARDIARDLRQGWLISGQPLAARHIAVLVPTNRIAQATCAALRAAGVPAMIAESGSVFETDEVLWLERWLRALTAEQRENSARSLGTTPLFALDGRLLFEARLGGEEQARAHWLRFLELLAHHGTILADQGVMAAFASLLHTPTPPDNRTPLERLSLLANAERILTNLRHLAELLHTAELKERLGPLALLRWLQDRRARGHEDAEVVELRLESDAQTVRVMTLHKSKGLEFPIVYLPFLHDGKTFRGRHVQTQPIRFHAPDGQLTIDLRGLQQAELAHATQAWQEIFEERLRLLYVALTRAEHRLVLYGGHTIAKKPDRTGLPRPDYRHSPLATLLHGEGPAATREANLQRLDQDPNPAQQLWLDAENWAQRLPGLLQLTRLDPLGNDPEPPPQVPPFPLTPPLEFPREAFDSPWRRESYSGLVGTRKGHLGQEQAPEDARDYDDDDDAPLVDFPHNPPQPRLLEVPVPDPPDHVLPDAPETPLRPFPLGKEAGTWVHEVLERLSFPDCTPLDPHQSLAELVQTRGERNGFNQPQPHALLHQTLPQILATPFGLRLGQKSLANVTNTQRLSELQFDLPIGPGDAWQQHEPVYGHELAQVLGTPRRDLPLPTGYLDHVRQMNFRPLMGYLTGAIDLVFSLEIEGKKQWFVADYKTNTLGPRPPGGGAVQRSCAGHYALPWMAAEMARKHYYIQYLLYLTALHRYLNLRLKEYDWERDVGGAVYLFVRGMLGPETPRDEQGRVNGVFVDKPPFEIIQNLANLFQRHQETK